MPVHLLLALTPSLRPLARNPANSDAVTLIRLLAFQPESEEPTKQRVEAWMHQLCVKTCTPFVDNFAAVRRVRRGVPELRRKKNTPRTSVRLG